MRFINIYLYLEMMESTPYKGFLDEEDRRLRDRRYPRIALAAYSHSCFYQLYKSKNDKIVIITIYTNYAISSFLIFKSHLKYFSQN